MKTTALRCSISSNKDMVEAVIGEDSYAIGRDNVSLSFIYSSLGFSYVLY